MGKKRTVTVAGVTFEHVIDAANHFGISVGKVYHRLRNSDDLEWVFGLKNDSPGRPQRRAISGDHNFLLAAPAAAVEWDHAKNSPLTPDRVTPGSGKKVWWRCSTDPSHEWQSAVRDRAPPKNGRCPFCSRKRASVTNRLAQHHPEIAAQFASDLNEVALDDLTIQSGRTIWWRCQAQHTWQARVADRVTDKSGCPYCSGRQAHAGRNLAALYPHLAREFDAEKNAPLKIDELAPASGKKVWWRCSVNLAHSWATAVSMRTRQNTGCPACANLMVSPDNCLLTLYPELSKQWHPTRNEGISPRAIVAKSQKRVWWKCPEGPDHEWKTTVSRRTDDKTGCPYCDGQKLSVTNRLDTVRPDIAARLVPELNPPNAASTVFYTDSKRKLWFRCDRKPEHVFLTRPYYFTVQNGSCPLCVSSRMEILVEEILLLEGVRHEREWRGHELRYKYKLPFDFYLPDMNAAIECDGEQHFKPMRFDKGPEALAMRQHRDRLKDRYCKDNGIALLRLRYDAQNPHEEVRMFLASIQRPVSGARS